VAVGVTAAFTTLETCGATNEAFHWASVTKLLSAYATLIAVDEEQLSLDDEAGPPGATVRHLLAHAAGYAMNGEQTQAEPGRRRIYSNTGYEVLGDIVAEGVGRPFAGWVHDRVLEPLSMTTTKLDGSPAHAAVGSVSDLLAFGRELLQPTLVSEELFAKATSVAFPDLDGVLPGFGRQTPNDWGLGFELRDGKSPHWTGSRNDPSTFGHFGQSGTFLWVDPVAQIACGAVGDEPFDEWAVQTWPELSDQVLAEYGP
jgi:CubicO group peptidase (beta-lactamase class C family)